MSKKDSAHTKALRKITSNPKKFGFSNVVSACIETKLFDNRGKLVSEPDVIFIEKNRVVHIIEYKGNGDSGLVDRAQEQLQRAVWWYGRYTDLDSEKIKQK